MKKRYAFKFFIIFILSLLYSAFNIGILAFINKYILTLKEANFFILIAFIVLLVLFFGVAYYVKFVTSKINNEMVYELRVRFAARVLHSKMIFDDKKPKILASLSKDISNISSGFMRLGDALQGSILLLLSFFYFIYLSPKLGVFVISWFVCTGVMVFYFINKAKKNYIMSRGYDDTLYKDYEELLDGFKELSISQSKSQIFKDKFLNDANTQKTANISAEINGGLSGNFLNFMMLGGIGLVMYLSLGLKFASFETATTVCLSMMFLRMPFMMTIMSVPSIIMANISVKKISELELIKYKHIKFSTDKTPLFWEKIEFKNVNFCYEKEFILKNINLTINKGEIIFLVGKNGSGKSTLFLLMSGLLTPSGGEILVDGKKLNDLNLAKFQNSLSVVFADFYLFGEISNTDDEKLNFWLEKLKLDDKVKFTKENGLIKFQSLNLSTGQKKRVALLQNLLEERDFLMLDEFAADQDPEFRAYFYYEILPLLKSKGVSVFAISHDDKYFDVADKIYKIDNGNLKQIK